MKRSLLSEIKTDCRYFRGSSPCIANKEYGANCTGCNMYDRVEENILIIKLGAAGDVIRTTPLLYALKKQYPCSRIHWLTDYPRFVPLSTSPCADEVYGFNLRDLTYLKTLDFDLVINLDKDREAIALAKDLKSKKKFGFLMKDGNCFPADSNAVHKFLTGVDDNFSRMNTKSYMQEVFEICGYEYAGERYLIDLPGRTEIELPVDPDRKVIGLNTGAGERWKSRLWKDDHWVELANNLCEAGFEVILLGGDSEHERNSELEKKTPAKYFGTFGIGDFINLVNFCDLVVTQVTMCMHLALALRKRVVLMNNIFNRNEFDLFGSGEIVEPVRECKCYFGATCRNSEYSCMDHITPDIVFNTCMNQLEVPVINN